MIKAADLRKGKTIIYEDEICVVHEAQHVAKGNKRSYMQTRLKNVKSGIIQDVRFAVDDRLEVPFVESKEYEFLYHDGQAYIVMDSETFEQFPIDSEMIGEAAIYLKPNEKVTATLVDGQIIGLELPNVVELEVTDAPPVVKGATVTNQPKDVTLETGARVRVPAFIDTGERVRIDTRSGEYIDRAK
jgi:elongation factor P